MSERYLVDTDVIIEYLRGSEEAADFIESLQGDLLISAITVAELFSGIRGEKERKIINQFLLAFEVIPVGESIARRGGSFHRQYRQSHGTSLADALIAVTARDAVATLVTFNQRHFPMLTGIRVPYQR